MSKSDAVPKLLWQDEKVRIVLQVVKYGPNKLFVEKTDAVDAFGNPVWFSCGSGSIPIEFFTDYLKLKEPACTAPSKSS